MDLLRWYEFVELDVGTIFSVWKPGTAGGLSELYEKGKTLWLEGVPDDFEYTEVLGRDFTVETANALQSTALTQGKADGETVKQGEYRPDHGSHNDALFMVLSRSDVSRIAMRMLSLSCGEGALDFAIKTDLTLINPSDDNTPSPIGTGQHIVYFHGFYDRTDNHAYPNYGQQWPDAPGIYKVTADRQWCLLFLWKPQNFPFWKGLVVREKDTALVKDAHNKYLANLDYI